MLVNLIVSALAFSGPARAPSSRVVRANAMMADDIIVTATSLQGPVIFWGSEGVLVGKEESDIKGYDNFGKFVAAVESAGLTATLKGAGPFTVFAPTDAAFADFGGVPAGMTLADVLKYHVVSGKMSTSDISGDLKTVQGNSLTYGRRFRKTFLDYAKVGIESEGASKGGNYPKDIECSNGMIHAIDCIMVPGAYVNLA
ncbi:FAS1 domain-containing protein [Pavlovales sp. CCMP2436]|nr:FAS1 domain-containing protein [Pavlovales sp. CCMP2436]